MLRARTLLNILLFALAAASLTHASVHFMTTGGGDFGQRWREARLIRARINPYDVSGGVIQREQLHRMPHVYELLAPEVQIPPSGYPPWAWPTQLLLVAPVQFQPARAMFLLVQFAALMFLLRQLLQLTGPSIAGLSIHAVVLAVAAIATTIRLGQFSILLLGFIAAAFLAADRGRSAPAGIWYGLALLKPTFALPFAMIFIARRQFRPLLLAFAVIAAQALATWLWLGVTPWRLIAQMLEQSGETARGGLGPVNLFTRVGLPTDFVFPAMAAIAVATALVLCYKHRSKDTIYLLAVAGVCARLGFYHRQYDDLLVVPLLLAFAFTPATRTRNVLLALVGCSLWVPVRYTDYSAAVQISFALIWLLGLTYCLSAQLSRAKSAAAVS